MVLAFGANGWAAISAGLAAIAAIAALWTAFQNRRLIKAALEPDLAAVQVSGNKYPELHITNGGGGVAKVVRFIWVKDGYLVDASKGAAAFLQPGSVLRVAAAVPHGPNFSGLVLCKDVRGDLYAWSFDDDRRRRRRRWWRKQPTLDAHECLTRFYPKLNVAACEAAEWTMPVPFHSMPTSSGFPKSPVPERRGASLSKRPGCASRFGEHESGDLRNQAPHPVSPSNECRSKV
jgi:hypothetical protein